MAFNRSRWAAVGAAVAVTLGAGGIGLVTAAGSSDPSVFVPITNCRLFDTRATEDVGPWDEPIGADQEITVDGHGDSGQCVGLPDTATALQLNVTAIHQTETTHLTVYPADVETLPNASNLNPQLGQSTSWNAVTVRLSPDGQFKVYNLQGSIDVLADVTGYFVPASEVPAGPQPALAATDGDDVTAIDDTGKAVVEATISTDGPGYVQASALGTASAEADTPTLSCSLSDTTAYDDGSTQSVELNGADTPASVAAMRTFEVVAAGDLTVSLICKTDVNTAMVANPQISLTYVPGAVTTETTETTVPTT